MIFLLVMLLAFSTTSAIVDFIKIKNDIGKALNH
jgi:hypothetical protein